MVLTWAERENSTRTPLFYIRVACWFDVKENLYECIASNEPYTHRIVNEMYRFLSVWAILSSTRITSFGHVTDLLEQFGSSTIAVQMNLKCHYDVAVSWYYVVYISQPLMKFSDSFILRLFILPMRFSHLNTILRHHLQNYFSKEIFISFSIFLDFATFENFIKYKLFVYDTHFPEMIFDGVS